MKVESFDIKSFLISKIEILVLILGLGYFIYANGDDMFWFVIFVVFCFLRAMTRIESLEKSIKNLEQEALSLKIVYDISKSKN
jgi:hypothetical protein